MKKTLFTLFTAINLALLYCPAAFALTEDEAAAAVDAHGKDAVSGNLFLWLLCAIAFLKVSTKLDGILHSLGIGVSRSPGSMLSEALLAFRGFEIGKAFMGLGAAKAAASTATTKVTPGNTFAGGLSGLVSRHVQQSTASSISGQSPWKHSMAILPVPAMLRRCPCLPLAKISPPQWQRQKTMPCWMHLSPPHRWRWRAIARLTFPLQGTVKLPCAPVAVLLLQNRPPFPLRPLSNRPL